MTPFVDFFLILVNIILVIMKIITLFLGLCLSLICVFGKRVNYEGYQVVRIFPQIRDQWTDIENLERLGIDLLHRNNEHADLLVPPQFASTLTDMNENGITTETLVHNVQPLIDSQTVNAKPLQEGSLEWDRYYRLADIHQYLEDLAQLHSPYASTVSVGKTYEDRDMKAIKISKSGETKPAVWIDATIHAREWITGAVCTFIIDQLLNSNDTDIQTWLDEYDFYILPITNPDGYEFSHTTDRFWRKSRSNNGSPDGCIGTDLNRNFDYHWLENGGASSNPCSNVYAGTAIFSNKETAAMRDFLTTISDRLVFYLSLHSAGQYILFPTGFSADRIPQHNTYMDIGNAAAEAHIVKYGTNFTAGNIFELMYTATGSSMDWVKDTLKTNLTFTYELRDKGQFGHLLPPDQIYPSALEFMDGLKVIMKRLSGGIPEVDP